MLIVLDTNVLVSSLLKENSVPGKIIDWVFERKIRLALDERIMQEYAEVTARPFLRIHIERRDRILAFINIASVRIKPVSLDLAPETILDPNDLPFAEVAVMAKAEGLVTGNQRHFMFLPDLGVDVLTPAEFVKRFE
jgi:putative PIN family toxin of toxin-antitoxin system